MPICIFSQIVFIHIPKCGGSSVEQFLLSKGEKLALYNSNPWKKSVFVNGHTLQHCTYRELESRDLIKKNFQIFTIIRNPIDRTISEYFYIQAYRPDLLKYFKTFDEFLNVFLSKYNTTLFDNHNISSFDFLINKEGKIDEKIKIFQFFETEKIEEFLGQSGLSNFHELKTNKNNFTLNENQKIKIVNYFQKDFDYFKFTL